VRSRSSARFFADLHVHSRYSRACSRDCDLEHLAYWAARKGIGVVGTGDFTHPAWAEEIRTKLTPAEPGLFRLVDDLERDVARTLPASVRHRPVRFMLSTEISTIYKRDDRTRKVHHLLYAPDLDAVAEITRRLARIGNLHSDGRPILGLDSRDLLEITLAAGEGCYLVPAHVWTPWFAVLGSKSGFDAVEDCYADLADEVFALETGLSADPAMFWRISGLDRYRLVGNSDAHSPPMLGRECSFFDTDLDYFQILGALRTGDGFGGSCEFFPEEGKYHLDGHRACGVRLTPAETKRLDGRCPVCDRPVTVGVLHRVDTLADRSGDGFRPATAGEVMSLVPLPEIVGEILGVGPKSKAVGTQVAELVARLGPELGILTEVPLDALARAGSSALVEAVTRLRRGEVFREAGYDGEYGVIRLFEPAELAAGSATLFDLAPSPVAGRRPRARTALAGEQFAGGSGDPKGDFIARTSSKLLPGTLLWGDEGGGVGTVLGGLDPEQRGAASVAEGPLLVVAGPGTGKTRTLVHAVAHRVRDLGVPPEQCLAVTFTRRAREEVTERLAALLGDPGDEAASGVVVTTFHGLGLRIVREQHDRLARARRPRVAEDALRFELLRDALPGVADTPAALRKAAGAITELKRARALGIAPRRHELSGPLARYDAALRERDLVDLDDLLTLPVGLLAGDPELAAGYADRWRHIWVDEYQDVDELQYRLLRLLAPTDGNLCAIGDPDQAIYGFRGADVGFFLRFQADFPAARVVTLTRNYRSTPAIVAAACQAVAPSTLVPGRVLVPAAAHDDNPSVAVHTLETVEQEAAAVADTIEALLGGTSFASLDAGLASQSEDTRLSFADIAVLYRTDRQSAPVIDALARKGFPAARRSHARLADAPGVRAIVAALRGRTAAGDAPSLVSAALRRAAQTAIDATGEPASELAALEAAGAGEPGGAEGRRATVAEIRAAVDLLAPFAADCGADLDRFLTHLALDLEVDTLDPRADRVSLLTLHAAKGLEFAVVFLIGCSDGLVPLRWSAAAGAAGVAEERRLFFVGMTRARRWLILTHATHRPGDGGETGLSPFVADIAPDLLERRTGPLTGRTRTPVRARQLRLV
jgi:DNA helicase II / ATP-dependent DNA helicase PcrA